MKLLIHAFAFFLLGLATNGFAQSSVVTLSSLKVMEVIESSSGELNTFMIELSASNPSELNRLEIIFQEGIASPTTNSIYIPVIVKDGKAQLDFEKYVVAFFGNQVRFNLKVRDQFKSPYDKITIKAHDRDNRETNQVEHVRKY